MTACFAILALWVLARIRFSGDPVASAPVPPLLAQLTSGARFADLASAVAQLQAELAPALVTVDVPASSPAMPSLRTPALRIGPDVAIAMLDANSYPGHESPAVLVADGGSGLAVVRASRVVPGLPPRRWPPQRLQQPRFLMATVPGSSGIVLRPVFVPSLEPVSSVEWADQIWQISGTVDLAPGAFLFTEDAELVGVVVERDRALAIVPGDALLGAGYRLLKTEPSAAGWLGVSVQSLTPSIAAATGARSGVVVTAVEPRGPAATALMIADVIEAFNGESLETMQHWNARAGRLAPGASVVLQVRRKSARHDVRLVAAAARRIDPKRTLGLRMRSAADLGAEVVSVAAGSAAALAGLASGDVITTIGEIESPSAAEVSDAFTATRDGQRLVVAFKRADAPHVTILEK